MPHIVVDGGGTNLRAARFDGSRETGRVVVPMCTTSYSKTLQRLQDSIYELRGGERLDAIGVSIAGTTDGERVIAAGNLGALVGKPFADDLREEYDCPVWLFGDAQAMGASEYSVQQRPLILVIWGSGVNFCLVLGDDILSVPCPGPSLIGEGGHQRIVDGGRWCNCGMQGCLEAYVGGTAIQQHYRRPAEQLGELEWDIVTDHLVHGVHNVITLTGGKLPLFFTGGIACRQAHRVAWLPDRLKVTRLITPTLPMISLATYGENAGLHGASVIVEHQLAVA